MTFGSVKSLMRAVDADFLKVDGASETARFFVPSQDRRVAKPRSRIRRFVRVS